MADAGGVAPPAKARKVAESAKVIVQLVSGDDDAIGPQLQLPHQTTRPQLETLANSLLKNDEAVPYAFYVQDEEVGTTLGSTITKQDMSVENVIRIIVQPQAVFRVRPVSRCSATMSGHSEAVLSVQFSPDGKHLVSGSGDTTVRFWDLATQLPRATGSAHKSWVMAVAWSPDAALVATGDKSGTVHIWSAATAEAKGRCSGHSKWITSIAWEPAHLRLPSCRVATASKDQTIRVWDAQSFTQLLCMSGHMGTISCVRWTGAGLLISAGNDKQVRVWNAEDGRTVRVLLGHAHWVNSLALSSEHALRTGAFDHHGTAPKNPKDAKETALSRYKALTRGLPERLVSGSDDHTMFLWVPGEDKKPKHRLTGHQQLINHVQFSPDGQWLLSASFDKSIKLWNGETGHFVATFRGHVGPVYQVSWSADSRLFVSASKDSTLKVWGLKTKALAVELPGHADEVFAVDWSPVAHTVASGGKDQVLKLWRH